MLHESRNNFLRKTVFQCFSTLNLLPVGSKSPIWITPVKGPSSLSLMVLSFGASKDN